MVDFKNSEKVTGEEAIRLATKAGKTKDGVKIKEKLEAIMGYQRFDKVNINEFMKFRQLKDRYLPSGDSISLLAMISLLLFSPYMTFKDLKWMLNFGKVIESNSELYEALFSEGKLSIYDYNLDYEVPIIIIAGDCDWITPHSMALQYFSQISAPNKEFIVINNTGHAPFLDKPKEFSNELLKELSHVG